MLYETRIVSSITYYSVCKLYPIIPSMLTLLFWSWLWCSFGTVCYIAGCYARYYFAPLKEAKKALPELSLRQEIALSVWPAPEEFHPAK